MHLDRFAGVFPFITVGVPTSNRAWSLPSFLNALERLDYPKERIRIVFVDNNSTDDTVKIIRQFIHSIGEDYEDVRLISEGSNIPQARNLCIENSEGEYIFFLDSDVVPPPDSVKRLLKAFRVYPTAAIISFLYRSRFVATQQENLAETSRNDPYSELLIQAGCTLISLGVFPKIGKFNTLFDFYEDYEFSVRAFRAGYLTLIDPSRVVQHLSVRKSQTTPKGIAIAFLFVFKSIGRGVMVAQNGSTVDKAEHHSGSYRTSLSKSLLGVLGIVFWKTFLTLVLMLFYSSSFAFQFWEAKRGRLADAIYFSWLGLPLLAAIATFIASKPMRSVRFAAPSRTFKGSRTPLRLI